MIPEKLSKFDLISDLHLDFYINPKESGKKLQKVTKVLLNRLLPKVPSKVLVVAGDISHYNNQTIAFLQEASKVYGKVFFCLGNHDFYILNDSQKKKYSSSWKRIEEIKKFVCENVHFVDNEEIIEVDGVKFGGASCWYDGSYIKRNFHWPEHMILEHWREYMNDYEYIWLNEDENGFNLFDMAKKMNEDVWDRFRESDVFISHIQPIEKYFMKDGDPSNGYYCFDGNKMMWEAEGKVWIYGHTHITHEYNYAGCNFLCNPFGYPSQSKGRKICTFDLTARKIVAENP